MPHYTLPPTNRLSESPLRGTVRRDSMIALGEIIEADELSVVFQPIVDLRDGRLFAHEALVRCSTDRFQSPPELFDRAVSAGCAGRLGRMIREIAIPLCSGVPLFVNVHPTELNEGWLVRPDDPIFSHDDEVYVEITESAPLTHFELCHSVLAEVRSRGGIHLVVDDLGAGYSNLMSIADLEPKVVKLDRGLVADIHLKKRQQQLVSGVVRLCVELGAVVVAEGIELVDELSAVRDTGAHYGQGYLLARPGYPLPEVNWPVSRTPVAPQRKRGRRL